MALRIGELLIRNNLIDKAQLDHALSMQSSFGGKLGTNLVELGYISDTALSQFLSKQLKMPAARAEEFNAIPRAVLDLVPGELAGKYRLVPLSSDRKIRVALCDPSSLPALDEIQFKTGKAVDPVIAPEIWVVAALERFYQIPREERFIKLEEEDTGERDIANMFGAPHVGPEAEIGSGYVGENTLISIQSYVERLLKAQNKEDVFTSLLDFLAPIYQRMAVYIMKRDMVAGWIVRGFAVHAWDFQKVEVAASAPTIFKSVMEKQSCFYGPIEQSPDDNKLISLLGLSNRQAVYVYPVLYRKKGVAVVLGLRDAGKIDPITAEYVRSGCSRAGLALEYVTIRKAISDIPT